MFGEGAEKMVRVDDVESARIAEGEREVVGGGRRGDSGWVGLDICLWRDLEYAAVVGDSDRILADALTPAAWVLLTRIAGCTLDPRLVAPPIMVSLYVSAPAMRRRATQRSPPQGEGRGRVSRCPAPDGAARTPWMRERTPHEGCLAGVSPRADVGGRCDAPNFVVVVLEIRTQSLREHGGYEHFSTDGEVV